MLLVPSRSASAAVQGEGPRRRVDITDEHPVVPIQRCRFSLRSDDDVRTDSAQLCGEKRELFGDENVLSRVNACRNPLAQCDAGIGVPSLVDDVRPRAVPKWRPAEREHDHDGSRRLHRVWYVQVSTDEAHELDDRRRRGDGDERNERKEVSYRLVLVSHERQDGW